MKRFISPANQGFSLVELMAAIVVAGLITTVTATVLIQNAESNAAAERRRRLLEDWNRATTLLQDEIAMSQSVLSEGDVEELRLSTGGCDLLSSDEAKLKLQMPLLVVQLQLVHLLHLLLVHLVKPMLTLHYFQKELVL